MDNSFQIRRIRGVHVFKGRLTILNLGQSFEHVSSEFPLDIRLVGHVLQPLGGSFQPLSRCL